MNKNNFPMFSNARYETNPLIYLDSAATSQKPKILSESLTYFYENFNSNIGRSSYNLAYLAQESYEQSRHEIAKFFNTSGENITFTLGATHSLNLCAHILKSIIKSKTKIVLSILEHHANILPWQKLAQDKNMELIYIDNIDYLNSPDKIPEDFWKDVSIVSLAHVTNTTGQIIPVDKWITLCREKNIFSVIDGSQAVCSFPVDLSSLQPDFYVFSAHKIYGPTGLGILYIDKKMIKPSTPLLLGGGIIEDVEKNSYILIDDIRKFEAGTPNTANVYAFSQTLLWLKSNEWLKELERIKNLTNYLESELLTLEYIKPMLNIQSNYKTHIFSFNIENIHSHDVGTFLDQKNICVRVGKHCAHPLHSYLNISSSIRVSLGIYNDEKDIKELIEQIKKCHEYFK